MPAEPAGNENRSVLLTWMLMFCVQVSLRVWMMSENVAYWAGVIAL